jgi:predicted esterase
MRKTKYNGFSMIGVFPRISTQGGIYTHALDRQTMFGTKEWWKEINRGNLYRIDRQFIAMQKDAKMHLSHMGRDVGQPILTGFSASSDFVSRINYLHPDLAKAVILNDPPTVPLEEYNGVKLNYPLGIADLEKLTGQAFNKEKFLDTPQFWFTGNHDSNDGTYFSDGWGNYHLTIEEGHELGIDMNQEGIDYRKAFGDEITLRKKNVRRILKEKGFNNLETHTYDVGHGINDKTLKDISNFLDKVQ